MQSVIDFFSSFSLAYIFAFPFILAFLKFDSNKNLNMKNKKGITSLLSFNLIGFFNLANLFLSDGALAGYFILIWFTLILPVTIAFYLLTNELSSLGDKEIKETKKSFYGYSYKTVVILSLSLVVALTFVITDTSKKSTVVLNYHKQFITKLSEAENKQQLLFEETIQPSYMTLGIIPDIGEIKNNEAHISFAYPWRIGVIVRTDTKSGSKYWKLEYIKDNQRWRLEGLHGKGF